MITAYDYFKRMQRKWLFYLVEKVSSGIPSGTWVIPKVVQCKYQGGYVGNVVNAAGVISIIEYTVFGIAAITKEVCSIEVKKMNTLFNDRFPE